MNLELNRDNPRVMIERVGGDLRVRAWERDQVAVLDDEGSLEPSESGVAVHSDGDLNLRVPTWAVISVENVGGDAKLSELEGPLVVGAVGGDLTLRDVGPVTVESVGGSLRVKRADGSVQAEKVGGDATIREVAGEALIEQVGGDLYVRDVAGSCKAEQVGADLVLSTDFAPGAEYRFAVGGDIVCRVPAGSSARFQTTSHELVVDAPGAQQVEGEDGDEVVFGDGEAIVSLEAGSEIRLVAQDEDYMMAINFHLEEDLAERLSMIEEQLSEKLSGLDEVIARQSEKIRNKAERSAERAMRQAERAARKAGKRRSFSFSFGGDPFSGGGARPHPARPPRAPEPPAEPVSEEERMTILRMVENKQISVEEAEKLLAALEGRRA